MDARTARAYDEHADAWIGERRARPFACRKLAQLAARLPEGARVADLGCGPGWYAERFRRGGLKSVAFDLSAPMLDRVRRRSRAHLRVRGDLARLPFAHACLEAAWAINTYQHLPFAQLPAALAQLHQALAPGAPVVLTLTDLEQIAPRPRERRLGIAQRRYEDRFGARLFVGMDERRIRALLEGAGFERVRIEKPDNEFWFWIEARRAHTLPDYVRPGLELLICGLNPSPVAADTGVPFGRPGNRFWPAALRAGLLQRTRDPFDALRRGVGFTDLAKRTTRSARELARDEYAAGLARLEDLVHTLRPRALCFAGLEGWRQTVDPGARAGRIRGGFAGRPAYLMPSPSGLNTHVDVAALARHLRRALRA